MALARRRLAAAAGAAALAPPPRSSRAQRQRNTVRVGVPADMSGPYRDIGGPAGVACARQAARDFGDRGSAGRSSPPTTRTSPTSPATSPGSGSTATAWTRSWTRPPAPRRSPSTAAPARRTRCTSTAAPRAPTPPARPARPTTPIGPPARGCSPGPPAARRCARAATPGSSSPVQAQASRAKVIGLANGGADTVARVKQAAESGVTRRGARIAALLVFITDVHSLGLRAAQGLVLSETFYCGLNERTRAFAERVKGSVGGLMPAMSHAGIYAGTLPYLKAVADTGAEAVARMKAMPTDDGCFGRGSVRADGRNIHPAHLSEVKKPEESRGPWDHYKPLQTTPAEEAFRPLGEGGCPLVRS